MVIGSTRTGEAGVQKVGATLDSLCAGICTDRSLGYMCSGEDGGEDLVDPLGHRVKLRLQTIAVGTNRGTYRNRPRTLCTRGLNPARPDWETR